MTILEECHQLALSALAERVKQDTLEEGVTLKEIADLFIPRDLDTLHRMAEEVPTLAEPRRDTYYDPESEFQGRDCIIYENAYQDVLAFLESEEETWDEHED